MLLTFTKILLLFQTEAFGKTYQTIPTDLSIPFEDCFTFHSLSTLTTVLAHVESVNVSP